MREWGDGQAVRCLAREGTRIVVENRQVEKAEKVLEEDREVESYGAAVCIDVRQDDREQRLIREAIAGRLQLECFDAQRQLHFTRIRCVLAW